MSIYTRETVTNFVKTLFGNKLVLEIMDLHSRNDEAHKWEHVIDVMMEVQKYPQFQSLKIKEKRSVYLAILCHDAMLSFGRNQHHVSGAGYGYSTAIRVGEEFVDPTEVYRACLEHRGSFLGGTRYSIISNLVASADRGDLDFWTFLKRAIDFRISQGKNSSVIETYIVDAINHLKNKYGKDGYALQNAPNIYMSQNSEKLKELWNILYDENLFDKILSNKEFLSNFN